MRFLTIALMAGLASAGCKGGPPAATTNTVAGSPAADTAAPTPVRASTSADAATLDASPATVDRIASREITIPAGTRIPIVLDTTVGSDISHSEEPVTAHLAEPVLVHGMTVIPSGSRIGGVVTDARRSGRVKGRAHIALRFDSLTPRGSSGSSRDGEQYHIRTTAVGRTAPGTKKRDALEIGAPAAGGALIGSLLGGGKGALIGTAVGGGAGTAVVLSTRGKEVHLNRGAILTLRLAEPLTVRVRG